MKLFCIIIVLCIFMIVNRVMRREFGGRGYIKGYIKNVEKFL